MKRRIVGADARVAGHARMEQSGRRRTALLLSTALGCSLLIAAPPARAQSIEEHAAGDINITQDVVNGEPFAMCLRRLTRPDW